MLIRRGIVSGLCLVVLSTFAGAAAAQGSSTDMPPPLAPSETLAMPTEPVVYVAAPPPKDTARDHMLDHPMAAPRRAFEIQLGGGLGYPWGKGIGDFVSAHPRLTELTDPGATLQLSLGYRATRHWMFGLTGSGSNFGRGGLVPDGTDIWSATAGLQADYHLRPAYVLDPWISLASGWRGFWLSPDNVKTTSVQGLEVARLNIGMDFRMTRGFALAPVISGDVSVFLTRSDPTHPNFTNIDPHWNYFFFAGLQGRFDIGGSYGTSSYAGAERHDAAF